jgi:hypothetical protein
MFSLDNTVMVEGPFVIVHTWEDPPKLDERGGTVCDLMASRCRC